MKCTESRGCGVKFKKFCSGTAPWAFHTSQEVSRYRGRNRQQALQQSLSQEAKIGELHLSTLLDLSFLIWVVLGAVVGPGVGARGKLSIFRFILWLVGDILFYILLAFASMKQFLFSVLSFAFPYQRLEIIDSRHWSAITFVIGRQPLFLWTWQASKIQKVQKALKSCWNLNRVLQHNHEI